MTLFPIQPKRGPKAAHPMRGGLSVLLAFNVLSLTAFLHVVSRPAVAQAVSGAKLGGHVSEKSGAVIAGAQVSVTDTEKGASFTTVSGPTGDYIFPSLKVGSYKLVVTAPGFNTYEQKGITLQVSADVKVNVGMVVGSIETSVTVDAGATQVQTEDTALTTIVDRSRIVDLPLNGRNAASLVLLSGGATPTANGNITSTKTYGSTGTSAIGGSLNISVAGTQGNQVNYLLDGGDNNHAAYNVNLPFPFPDALQEFSVQTTGLAAQYGVHPGGTVSIVTRSGTNAFHGGVFEFLRNNYANAANRISGKVDSLKRNQFGGQIGGPVLHNRLFFFGGYQGTVLHITPTATTAYIPTNAELAGNWTPYFQALKNNNRGVCTMTAAQAASLLTAGFTTADPATCSATVSPSLYSKTSLGLGKYLPTSTVVDELGTARFAVAQPQTENQFIGRMDYTLSSRQTLFARYFMANYSSAAFFNGNLLNTANPGLIERAKNLTLGHDFAITQHLSNSLRLTGNRMPINRSSAGDLINLASLGAKITNPVRNFLSVNVSGGFTASCGACAPVHLDTNQIQLADDATLLRGRHLLAFGVDVIAQKYNAFGFSAQNGQYNFNGSYSGFGLVDYLLGAPATFSQSNGGSSSLSHYRQNYFGYYVQDTFRINPRLVLNAGIRWEPWFPTHDADGKGQSFSIANFNAGTVSRVFTNAPAGLIFQGDAGVQPGFANKRLLNFSPRFGFAFDPTGTGKSSLRASYSLIFDTPSVLWSAQGWAGGVPYAQSQTINLNNQAYKDNFTNPWQGVTGGNPFPTPYPPPANVAFPTGGINPQTDLPGQRSAYVHEYNASYQQQLSPNWLATISYIGTHTVHLWGLFPVNYDNFYPGVSTGLAGSCGTLTPVPAAGQKCSSSSNTTQRYKLYQATGGTGAGTRYGFFNQLADYGMANYNGVITSVNHRIADHFTVLVNYTWSKCLSNENFSGDNTAPPQNPNDIGAEYGPCNFDVSQNLVISGVLESPHFKQHSLDLVAGGWRISPLFSHRTGLPFNPIVGSDASLSGVGQDRPNLVPGVPVYKKNFFTGLSSGFLQWYDPAAFAAPAPGTFGNLRPYSFRGPGFTNMDVAIAKVFSLPEKTQLELRCEAFNAFNHPNYGTPGNAQSFPSSFGFLQNTANDPRLFEVAAKLNF